MEAGGLRHQFRGLAQCGAARSCRRFIFTSRSASAILAERVPSPMAFSHLHHASTHPLQEVRELGGAIVCGAPVRHISQSSSGVSVISDAGT